MKSGPTIRIAPATFTNPPAAATSINPPEPLGPAFPIPGIPHVIRHLSVLNSFCTMLTTRLLINVALFLFQMVLGQAAWSSESDSVTDVVATVLEKHCVKCHGSADEIQGDVNLLSIRSDNLTENIELVGALIEALDQGAMPPEDEPSLEPHLRRKLILELKATLHATVSQNRNYAQTPLRRMNRFQYNNAVIDLFDLNCTVFTLPERMMRDHNGYFRPDSGKMGDVVSVGSRPLGKSQMIEPRLDGVAAFPQDLRAEHGFDNRGDHLSLSPLLMESFLKLGQSIMESPDFVPRNVGIWQTFFQTPRGDVDLRAEARRRLDSFLTRAFRRPVEDGTLDRYADLVARQLDNGVEFVDAMKLVAAAAISSPNFLYLYDKSSESTSTEPVDDFDLASRLSFFLWGSIPDSTLLELAKVGQLKQPDVLDAQFRRMITNKKLKRFCDSFPSQWLQLERIISSVPDPDRYSDFYFAKYRRSMHMMLEPLLLFETVLIENLPVTQFIDSDFTYRSGLLEDAYGELGIDGDQPGRNRGEVTVLRFHRVPVSDRRCGGVITNAAVMTMTSGPNRTQPITRGAWIATVIFNHPPEPPPADVPPLDEKPAAGQEHLTLRERLSMHRQRSDCKGCHEQIDPLGFALENYDPVGQWRQTYDNGRDVDVAGTLFRKHAFTDVIEFKEALLAEKDRFTRALAGHLLSFALARQLDASDQVALDTIAEATARDDYRIQTLIKQVIISDPFLSKSNPTAPGQ